LNAGKTKSHHTGRASGAGDFLLTVTAKKYFMTPDYPSAIV